MPLPHTYADSNCSMARSLEIVGERWTLLVIRNAFYGVRRFGDFASQLGIPRAVLTSRLKSLVEEGVLAREQDEEGKPVYVLTDKGAALWPVIRALMAWGDEHYSPAGPRRLVHHDRDGGLIDGHGRCDSCGAVAPVAEIRMDPGPGFDPALASADPVSAAIDHSVLLLRPLRRGDQD